MSVSSATYDEVEIQGLYDNEQLIGDVLMQPTKGFSKNFSNRDTKTVMGIAEKIFSLIAMVLTSPFFVVGYSMKYFHRMAVNSSISRELYVELGKSLDQTRNFEKVHELLKKANHYGIAGTDLSSFTLCGKYRNNYPLLAGNLFMLSFEQKDEQALGALLKYSKNRSHICKGDTTITIPHSLLNKWLKNLPNSKEVEQDKNPSPFGVNRTVTYH